MDHLDEKTSGFCCPDELVSIWHCMQRYIFGGSLQVSHTGEHFAADALVDDVSKLAVNHVELGNTGKRQ